MSEPRIIPVLDALSEAAQLTAQVRSGLTTGDADDDLLRLADAIDRQTAVLRLLVDVLERIDMPPGTGRSLPNVAVPPSRWLDAPP